MTFCNALSDLDRFTFTFDPNLSTRCRRYPTVGLLSSIMWYSDIAFGKDTGSLRRSAEREARSESFIPKQLALAPQRRHRADDRSLDIRNAGLSIRYRQNGHSLIAIPILWSGLFRSAGHRCAYRRKTVHNRDHIPASDTLLSLRFPADVVIRSSMVTHCKSTIGPQTALIRPHQNPRDSTSSTLDSPSSLSVAF
jgi:hypothetical protein